MPACSAGCPSLYHQTRAIIQEIELKYTQARADSLIAEKEQDVALHKQHPDFPRDKDMKLYKCWVSGTEKEIETEEVSWSYERESEAMNKASTYLLEIKGFKTKLQENGVDQGLMDALLSSMMQHHGFISEHRANLEAAVATGQKGTPDKAEDRIIQEQKQGEGQSYSYGSLIMSPPSDDTAFADYLLKSLGVGLATSSLDMIINVAEDNNLLRISPDDLASYWERQEVERQLCFASIVGTGSGWWDLSLDREFERRSNEDALVNAMAHNGALIQILCQHSPFLLILAQYFPNLLQDSSAMASSLISFIGPRPGSVSGLRATSLSHWAIINFRGLHTYTN
ncbi:unnamed protein product [Symbiodinium necroappetens]|uniref:Uncharacterized protein n=1 Tax=Symbiodinium necroappetens TaxID=1628268 RepID=A0A812P186_9DINO|nr:unnamed protein product [Symbiodinium necroappetens]